MSALPHNLATELLQGISAPVTRPARRQSRRAATAEVVLAPEMTKEAIDRLLVSVDRAVARGAGHVRIECRPLRQADMPAVAAFVAAARRLHRAGVTSELASPAAALLHLIDLHQVRAILVAADMRLPAAV